MLERLSAPSQFQEEKITEIYKGREIEVFRSERDEKLHGCKCWTAFYHHPNGKKIDEPGLYRTAEECLKVTRAVINWDIEQEEISDRFLALLHEFEAKNYTQAGILSGFSDAISRANWSHEVELILQKAVELLQIPGRMLP